MTEKPSQHKIIGIGAVLVDEIFYCREQVITGTSNPADMKRSAGGVMRNIMHHLALLGTAPTFLTVTGEDEEGKWLHKNCMDAGIQMKATTIKNCNTGKYVALINPDGSMHAAAAYNPCEAFLNIGLLQDHLSLLSAATIITADTNLSAGVLQWLVQFCNKEQIKLCIEPVSLSKAGKLSNLNLENIFMLTPNEEEIMAICPNANNAGQAVKELLEQGVQKIWLRSGANGSVMYSKNHEITLAAPDVLVKDTTGAGDAALAGWLAAFCNGFDEYNCLKAGHTLAAMVLQTNGSIAENTSFEKLITNIKNIYPGE